MESLQRLDKGGILPPSSRKQAPDSKFSSFQSFYLTLSYFWSTQRQTSTSSYTRTCLPRLTLSSPNGPPRTRLQLSWLCDLTQGGQSSNTAAVWQRKKLNVWLLRVIVPVYIPTSALLLKKNFVRSHWHTHTVGLSISSASARNRSTEKLNQYGMKIFLLPTAIEEVTLPA